MYLNTLQIFLLLFGLFMLLDILMNIRLLKQKEFMLVGLSSYFFIFVFLYLLFFHPDWKVLLYIVIVLGSVFNFIFWRKRFYEKWENSLKNIFKSGGKLTGFGLFLVLIILLILKIIFKAP